MLTAVLTWMRSFVLSRSELQLENLALRHQLAAYQRSVKRFRLRDRDRILWVMISRLTAHWRGLLYIARPRTVIGWRRRRFREYWARLCRCHRPGRPQLDPAIRSLIRQMSSANPLWRAPRILGELRMLGIELAESTVAKYMIQRPRPASPTWSAFLRTHLRDMVSVDFFVVPTIRNRMLHVFLVLSHARRRVLHFNVTTNPSAEWTARQLLEAFAWMDRPRYLLWDRDRIYGGVFQDGVSALGMMELLSGPRKPWQNPYVERLIGTIRRECLDHGIVLGERHLKRVLRGYLAYYHGYRTHLALKMDAPGAGPSRPRVASPPFPISAAFTTTTSERPDVGCGPEYPGSGSFPGGLPMPQSSNAHPGCHRTTSFMHESAGRHSSNARSWPRFGGAGSFREGHYLKNLSRRRKPLEFFDLSGWPPSASLCSPDLTTVE